MRLVNSFVIIFKRFRSGIKEMEVMIINVINAVFDTVTYVEQGVEILDAFMHLSAREVRFLLFFVLY